MNHDVRSWSLCGKSPRRVILTRKMFWVEDDSGITAERLKSEEAEKEV
jgi:hypothetical protein